MKAKIFFLLAILFFGGCKSRTADIRVGYMPNLTHASALLGFQKEIFNKHFRGDVSIEGKVFSAGPSVIEALYAGSLDLAYVGPAPAVNAMVRTKGDFVVIAGAASGGGGVVVLKDSGIENFLQLKDERILTPQLGNSQDLAARSFLTAVGIDLKDSNGKPKILPISNPDQLNLFKRREVNVAWTVEPWVSRLIYEGNGRLLFDESDVWKDWVDGLYATTLILVSKKFLNENPQWIRQWLSAHVEVTAYINGNSDQAREECHNELAKMLGRRFEDHLFANAWKRIYFTYDPMVPSLYVTAKNAKKMGFLRQGDHNIRQFIDLKPLFDVL